MRFHRLLSRFMLLAAFTPCVLPGAVHAAVIYDGFGYAPGEDLSIENGGDGWGGSWDHNCCFQTFTTGSGLAFGALAVTPGAAQTPVVPAPPNNVSIYTRSFGSSLGADNTTVFFSFLLRPDTDFGFYGGINLGTPGSTDFFVGKSGIIPGSDTPSNPGGTPVANYSLEGNKMVVQSGVAAVAGTTVLLVVRVEFHDGMDDVLDLYVNPTLGGTLPAVSDATLALPNVALNYLYINNATGWTTDEIRLGSTFADVTPTPAPATSLLMAGGLAAVALGRRRDKRTSQAAAPAG
jgi:hypothetical protein